MLIYFGNVCFPGVSVVPHLYFETIPTVPGLSVD